jgi:predicted aspartyl protease
VLLLAVTPAAAQLYRWTDPQGVVRYTNDRSMIPPSHRDIATDIGSPTPRPAPAPTPRPAAEKSAERSVVTPFTAGGPINVPASIDGVGLTLMVDTGADRTVISPAALARVGVQTAPNRSVRVLGVAGSTATAGEAVIERLDLGGSRVGPLPVLVLDIGAPGIDGLLGRDVLDKFTLTIDASQGRATLAPR